MTKTILYTVFAAFIVGCKSYSTYSIDKTPQIKIESRLLGTWKAVEDTDKKNCIVVQNFNDIYGGYKIPSFVDSSHKDRDYFITYLNRHGRNPYYDGWNAFLSKLEDKNFLNIRYSDSGFLLVRIIKINPAYDTIVTSMVADTTLANFPGSTSLSYHIRPRLNDPSFYSDTLHFFKINSIHKSLEEARDKANIK